MKDSYPSTCRKGPLSGASLMLGLLGLAMVLYLSNIMQRMRHIPDYQTSLKDWLWYMAFPLVAYIVVIMAALALPANPALALQIVSVAVVALLFLGIRNAWDLVTYFAVERAHPEDTKRE